MGQRDDKPTSSESLGSTSEDSDDALEEEYDLQTLEGGVRGKYYDRVRSGPYIVILDPDIHTDGA